MGMVVPAGKAHDLGITALERKLVGLELSQHDISFVRLSGKQIIKELQCKFLAGRIGYDSKV